MTETTIKTIPDLWEIAHLEALKGYTLGGKSARDLIIETWHLAHDLRKSNAKLLEACLSIIDDLENGGDVFGSDEKRIGFLQSAIHNATQSTTGAHT